MDIEKQQRVDRFLAQPKILGRLATVSASGQPHVVPVWFLWEDGCIWIHSYATTRKVRQLQRHPKCAFVVDVFESAEGLTGVLFEGTATLITEPHSEVRSRAEKVYRRYLDEAAFNAPDPQSWLDSEEGLIICLKPAYIKAW